jgi:hypothetical protein
MTLRRNLRLSSYTIALVSLFLSACSTSDTSPESTNLHSEQSVADAGYAKWHNQMIHAKNAINGDKKTIEQSYDIIRNFDKKSMTSSWLNEISAAIANNKTYRRTIIEAAGSNKIGFAETLLNNPKNSIYYQGASDALISGLKHVESFDYQYRNLSNAFEDSARGRTKKTLSQTKNISNISLKLYESKNNTPSVAEQMLTIAAVKILGLSDNPKLQTAYNKTLMSNSIETCLGNAQRNSAQCKAASYDKNDLSFCMAKHAIAETSQCFSWILP